MGVVAERESGQGKMARKGGRLSGGTGRTFWTKGADHETRDRACGGFDRFLLCQWCCPGPGADWSAAPTAPSFPVSIRVDATNVRGEMRPVWRYFGYDEPNYTYMKDGEKLLSQLSALSPEHGLYSHTQSADIGRWPTGSQMGLDGGVHGR